MFEIGNSLRDARERQVLDYQQVELATKIRAKYVRALEDEEFDVLPGDTYIKGFLRSYADYLGLDGQLYVDEYTSRFVVDGYDGQPLVRNARTSRLRHDRGVERKVLLLALLGISTLTALVIVAWKFGGADTSGSTPIALQTAQAATPPSELQITGVGAGSYVEVRRRSARGKILLQATVPRGNVERVAGSRFFLYVRRPDGVSVQLDGKHVSLPAHRNLRVVVTPKRTARVGG